jgi:hypothetical protein
LSPLVIPIPASVVYNLSKEYFSRPMLEPQVGQLNCTPRQGSGLNASLNSLLLLEMNCNDSLQ